MRVGSFYLRGIIMTQLFKKEFNLKSAIEYLEFWRPIDGPARMMVLWSEMGDERIRQVITNMGYDLDKINQDVSLNIIRKAFGDGGLVHTHRILLETFRKEFNPDICIKCGSMGAEKCKH